MRQHFADSPDITCTYSGVRKRGLLCLGAVIGSEAHPELGPETRAPVMMWGLGFGEAYCGLLALGAAHGTTADGQDAAGLGMCVGGFTPQPTT